MRHMEELRSMLCEELEEITERGDINERTLDAIDKLTHSIKSIDTIEAMKRSRSYGDDGEYSRGRKRDSMGRYAAENSWMERLQEMERSAPNDHMQKEIRGFISRMKTE